MTEAAAADDSALDHNLTPDQRDRLLLNLVQGVGPRLRQNLMAVFGSATAILNASSQELAQVEGIGRKLSQTLAAARREVDGDGELAVVARHGATLLWDDDPAYPPLLRQISDPPSLLYQRGELTAADHLAVAVVGTRHATRYGQAQAERLAAGLAAAGVTVISGLARGIDATAHKAALQAGGRTVAVLGGGLAKLYPPEHRDLARQITGQGAVMSEFSMVIQPSKGTFPQRNRLISGLALGVLVVEAAEKSGAMVTARHALDQGREVLAVPGQVDNPSSRGCHRLIKDGAVLVESVDDILEALGPLMQQHRRANGQTLVRPAELLLSDGEAAILNVVDFNPTLTDDIIHHSGRPAHQVMATLTILEMRKLVKRCDGNRWVRVV